MIISSQHYLDEDTVEAKRADGDYTVTLSPEFEIDGETVQAVIDGHHSLAAANADGVEPTFVVATAQDDDRVLLLETSVDDYLTACWVDTDWYDVATGRGIF